MDSLTGLGIVAASEVLFRLARKPTVPEVEWMVREYKAKPGNGAGGALHIVLDDCNVHDEHVDHCIERALELDDKDGIAIGRLLRMMSKTQRLKLAR